MGPLTTRNDNTIVGRIRHHGIPWTAFQRSIDQVMSQGNINQKTSFNAGDKFHRRLSFSMSNPDLEYLLYGNRPLRIGPAEFVGSSATHRTAIGALKSFLRSVGCAPNTPHLHLHLGRADKAFIGALSSYPLGDASSGRDDPSPDATLAP